MKTFAVISALATAAWAQSSASPAAASTPSANPLIPSGISSGCSSFLSSLNSDSSLSSCTSPLISASQQFGPGPNATTPSASTISSALNSICSSSGSSCTDQTVRGKLSDFYSACQAELTSSPNTDVLRTYDVLYALTPLKQAVCTKDDSGRYCVTEATSGTSSAAASPSGAAGDAKVNAVVGSTSSPNLSNLKQYLWSQSLGKRDAAAQTAAIIPNTTTYRDSNLLFMFLTPQTPSAQLCTSCTRNVLMSYINFESSVPYAPGLKQSPLMGGQSDLYQGVLGTCGKNFFNSGVQAAGGLSGGVLGGSSSAAPKSVSQDFIMLAAFLSAVVVAFASVL